MAAFKGKLKDFPVSDVFQLLDQQKKSGVLKLTNKKRASEVRVMFERGKIVGADSPSGRNREPLGAMLVRSGLVSGDDLDTALAIQKKTLRKLGDILVSNEALALDKLKQFLALQTQETVYRLFLWRNGEYEFLTETPRYEPELATPMSPQHLVMDSLRMMDEWPSIRKQIEALDAVPGRVHDNVDRVVRFGETDGDNTGADGDDDIDGLFAAWDDFEKGKTHKRERADGGIELGQSQTIVWDLVNGDRTIQEIVDRSLLGEFNTAKAVATLIQLNAVRILGRRKPQTTSTRISALPQNARQKLLNTVLGITASLGIIGLAMGAVLLVQFGNGNPVVSQQHGPAPGRTIDGAFNEVASQRKRKAEDVYWLMEGTYPKSPEDLAQLGLH